MLKTNVINVQNIDHAAFAIVGVLEVVDCCYGTQPSGARHISPKIALGDDMLAFQVGYGPCVPHGAWQPLHLRARWTVLLTV